MSAGSVTAAGGLTLTAADPQTSTGEAGTVGSTDTTGEQGSSADTAAETAGDATSAAETTGVVVGCNAVDDSCEGDGFCVMVEAELRCSHGNLGDYCDDQTDCGTKRRCIATETQTGRLGVCSGNFCEVVGDACETAGVCVSVNSDSGPIDVCSHGLPWEPCTVDDDCASGVCDPYDDALGPQNRCA